MRRGNLFWGFVLVLIGILFLLSTFGLLSGINPWNIFWPILLIGCGVWVLFGNLFGRRFSGEARQVSIPLEGATSARVKISHGAGRLSIDNRADPGELLSGTCVGGVQSRIDHNGGEINARLRPPDYVFPNWGWTSSLDWTLGLNRDIPIKLEVGTGASESNLDLTDLRVTELQIHTGASATKASLPTNAGYTRVTCEAGAAGIQLNVPAGVAARIHYRGGLSSINVDTFRFPRSGDAYQSTDYDTAANKVDIDVQMGVGSVEVH